MTTLFISHSSKDKAWAERVHQALSDRGYQCLFLDSHPDDGIHAGADWERTLYQRLRQSRGVVVLCTANWLASPWCIAEAMMARERKRRVFLLATPDVIDGRQVKVEDIGLQIPDFLRDRQFISLAGLSEEAAHQMLLQGLEKEGLKKHDFKLPARPYPGLEPFKETDAAVFFGRDEESDQVIDMLHKCRKGDAKGFILVLGASGCGKSSLVRAGVLPQLKHAAEEEGARAAWVVVPPFLGGKGLDGLALSLAQAFKEASGSLQQLGAVRARLAAAHDLCSLASELLLAHNAPEGCLLLVLDQLEEVFGTDEGSAARATLGLLLNASADPASRVVVLATMRSDFLNAFQLFEGAAKRYEKITLDPMLRSHFSEVIEGPADRFGLDLDPGLTERMVQETAYNDALPLLAFTLEKLYEKCKEQGRLTLAAYEELGGVSGAIAHAADGILEQAGYSSLPAEDQRMRDLRRAFFSLAQVGEEGQFTRRIAPWSRVPTSCEAILNRFVGQRLLVSDTANGERIFSVAHEALFRVWHTLHGWLLDDRKALALRSQIEEAAAEWDAARRAENRRWPEERILDAVREIGRSGVSLDDVMRPQIVRAFLGPTDRKELAELAGLGADQNETAGSGRYGDGWRLPLSHQARASVGIRLALLGDHRRGVGLRPDGLPDIAWCNVPAGVISLKDPRTRASRIRTWLKPLVGRDREFSVPPFQIAKYPVTWVQYRTFLDGRDGYANPKWWTELGNRCEQPGTQFHRRDNCPAENVSWFDAVAFCRWLSVHLGYEVRLPTEWEWQQAATGGDMRRVFPWGLEWDAQYANTAESGLSKTTAVGVYPTGASPVGALDMSGNVWEWCLNEYEHPENTRLTGEADRVTRGGAWDVIPDLARSAWREPFRSRERGGYLGFRVSNSRSNTPRPVAN